MYNDEFGCLRAGLSRMQTTQNDSTPPANMFYHDY